MLNRHCPIAAAAWQPGFFPDWTRFTASSLQGMVTRVNRFAQSLAANGLQLRRTRLETLQINVGRKCNQACRHCHVDAAPWRTEMIDETTARRVAEWIERYRPPVVDITGGAPELSEHFRFLVEVSRRAGARVID